MTTLRNIMPKGVFEFVDNGVMVTLIDSTNGSVLALNFYPKIGDACEHYKTIVRQIADKYNSESEEEEPEEDEEPKIEPKKPKVIGTTQIKKKELPRKHVEEDTDEDEEEAISI
jgi:hypothetical protein